MGDTDDLNSGEGQKRMFNPDESDGHHILRRKEQEREQAQQVAQPGDRAFAAVSFFLQGDSCKRLKPSVDCRFEMFCHAAGAVGRGPTSC